MSSMNKGKSAIILPPAPSKKPGSSAKRAQSAGQKKNFNASGSQFANNNSYLSSSSKNSNDSKKEKLNNSFEEKKKRLKKLQQLLKGEKTTLKEDVDPSDEEEFEFLMKETAVKEFQKQVVKWTQDEGTTVQNDELQKSTTIKKENLPGYIFANNPNFQETLNAKQQYLGKENYDTLNDDIQLSGQVVKNPPPKRGEKQAMLNNFTEDTEQTEQKSKSEVKPKKIFIKKSYTDKQKIYNCILIQSVIRMSIQKKRYQKEKIRLELLLKEHQMQRKQKREEEEEELQAIQQGKTPLAGRYTIHFLGLNNNKLDQSNDPNSRAQMNLRPTKKRTLSEGPFSLYEKMKQNQEEGMLDEDLGENKTYKLYQSKFNPLRKVKPPIPTKVPLNNNFFSDKGIVDVFVKKNRNNLPLALKKSTSSGDSFVLSTMPEYQQLLQKSKSAVQYMQNQQPKQQTKLDDDSIVYSDTFEKESMEATPVQKKYPPVAKNTSQNKRLSIHSGISEDDYLKDSFELETPQESIKESFAKESIRFQSSFSGSYKIKEDIPEESMMGESINEYSIVDETENKSKKKKDSSIQEEFIQTSIEDEDYDNEKFESISEDFNDNSAIKNSMRESISEDIGGMSFESRSKRGKKKSVTFGQQQHKQIIKAITGGSTPQAANISNQITPLNNNNSGILRKSNDSLSVEQMISLNQKSKDSLNAAQFSKIQQSPAHSNQQTIHEMYFGKDGVSDTWKKFEQIKSQYDEEGHSKELTKEQIELGRVQKDIYQMLQNTKNLADQWHDERDKLQQSDKAASLKAEQLYSKFQAEFNRILQTTPMVNKFSLLKNYLEYRDRQMKNMNLYNANKPNLEKDNTTAEIKKEVANQVETMVQNFEQKQEIMYRVLVQVVENLSNVRQTSMEFEDMKRVKDFNNSKLDQVLANQEKIIKFQFEQEMQFREDQLKLLYSGQPISEEELKRIRLRQLLSQNRKDQILSSLQPERANIVPNLGQQIQYVQVLPQQMMKNEVNDNDNNRYNDISQSSSIDLEAMTDSKVSWQSGEDMWDNLNDRDREKINDFNTEEVVNFLSEMLLQEIQQDLFPMRMTTSHLSIKKNDRLIQDKSIDKISPPKHHSQQQQQQGEKKSITASLQDAGSPVSRSNISNRLKSDRTLTEESKYESDFEDSGDKFGQSLQSNRSNNKSYQFEDNDTSGSKPKILVKEDNKKSNHERLDEQDDEEEVEEEEEDYEQDFEESIEKQTSQHNKLDSQQLKLNKQSKNSDDFDDPMGLSGKAFDRNSLMAELEENDKNAPPSSLPKVSASLSKQTAKPKQFDDDDYKGDNDFFEPQVENESGQIDKNPNKNLYKNQDYYDKTNRCINQLKSVLKKKKKMPIVKQIIQLIATNSVKGKKLDSFLGTTLPLNVQIFEQSDCKNDDERIVAQALQEHIFNNMIKNIQDLEQFHHNQTFNRKEIQAEIIMRWDHICDVAASQTLSVLDKVVPVDYYGDVKINRQTPFKKVKRFCMINSVAKEDNDLFEIQNYELYKEQVLCQNELSDEVLQKIVNQLARDLISIQNKQSTKN